MLLPIPCSLPTFRLALPCKALDRLVVVSPFLALVQWFRDELHCEIYQGARLPSLSPPSQAQTYTSAAHLYLCLTRTSLSHLYLVAALVPRYLKCTSMTGAPE